MKRALWTAVVLAVVAAAQPVGAAPQSGGEAIARYTKAQGRKALRRVASATVVGTVVGGASTVRYREQSAGPDRFVRELEVGGVVVGEGYNGKSAWRRDAKGVRTLVDLDARQVRLDALLASSRFQDLSRHRVAVRALGTAVVDGRPAAAVELALDGARERVYFDHASGLPVKRQRTVEGQLEELLYGDYRRVGGVLEPFSIRLVTAGRETRVTVERVDHNPPADESAFRVPSTGAGAPDLAALLQAVRDNHAKVEELRERYAYRETRTERRDGKGGAVDGETRVFRVLPVAGRRVRELLSVDGKALTAAEREKERRRVAERIEEALEESRKRRARAEKAAAEGKSAQEGESITIATFLRASEISSVRRATLRGRELLAFDFEPRDGFKPTSLPENVASKLAGTIWVDEAALQVVRLEARLTKKVTVGGGALGWLSPDSTVVLEQAKVNDEVWLPSYEEINISGRFLLLAKVRVNMLSRFGDYERYEVDSEYQGAAPARAGAESQDAAVAMIARLGGTVERDESLPGTPVVTVDLHASAVTDADLEPIGRLSRLRRLDLRLTKISDAGARHLRGLTGLKSLNLFRTGVTDAGLGELAPLAELETLLVGGTKVTDRGMTVVAAFRNLKKLSIFDTAVTDAGVMRLAGLSKLEVLLVGRSRVPASVTRDLQAAIPGVRFSETM